MALSDIFRGIEGAIGGIGAAVGGNAGVSDMGIYPPVYGGGGYYPAPAPQGSGGFVLAGNGNGLSGSGSISMGEILLFGLVAIGLIWLLMTKSKRG